MIYSLEELRINDRVESLEKTRFDPFRRLIRDFNGPL